MKALFGIFALVVLIVATAVPRTTHADDYPNKPIRVISDSAPGSAVDVTFRLVMDRLGTELGQPIAPVAQPGAGRAIAARAASESISDGYTLFASAISPFISLPGEARRRQPSKTNSYTRHSGSHLNKIRRWAHCNFRFA
jgi:tripartite-type tricarboxylate transporter receptor subunit TctC